jgi:hypothetical protein
MNAQFQVALNPNQERLVELINIGRPLTDAESDELYRLLHADYMRKWRAAKRKNEQARRDLQASEFPGDTKERFPGRAKLLATVRKEARRREWHQEL